MPPTKLSKRDQQEILVLYRNSDETTTTLAERYGVSSSSISRFLKKTLTPEEYDLLIAQKRAGRGTKTEKSSNTPEIETIESAVVEQSTITEEIAPPPPRPTLNPSRAYSNIDDPQVEQMDIISLEEMLGEELDDGDEDFDEVTNDIEPTLPPSDQKVTLRRDKKTPVKILPIEQADLPPGESHLISRLWAGYRF